MGILIQLAKVCAVTNDSAYTNKELKDEVYKIAQELNLQPSMATIVINSFSDGGLVETYDDLGVYDAWKAMVEDMLEQAFRER